MATANLYPPQEIRRRTAEFEKSVHRSHQRFAAGAITIGIAIVALVLMTFYFMQIW
jgi:hypothetical protein